MGHNILIVDDSATTRAYIRRAISLSGVGAKSVYEAANGEEALGVMACHDVDVLLADLQMPRMDGHQMLRRIFDEPKHRDVAVIVISADPNKAAVESLLNAGAKGYLPKPFTPEAFRRELVRVLAEVARV
jgi:two-component system chemotaxis response regulator CheY